MLKDSVRGKSGPHRAGCLITSSEGNLKESATENNRHVFRLSESLIRCGKGEKAR